ncbi:MAG: hypothetical protein AAF495_00775 [Pseudomonadota bacterium]
MTQSADCAIRGGPNIAMKVPPHRFAATVAFYRDTLSLPVVGEKSDSIAFTFGPVRLWIDRVERISQAELWLELSTDDTAAAAKHLQRAGVARCDAVEPLPKGFDGFWIINPADIIHLVSNEP